MIYTIGHKDSYLSALEQSGEVWKMGALPPIEKYPNGYEGGYAFKTVKDAQRRINEAYSGQGYSIFGLDCEWENTTPNKNGWWSHIIEDALIIFGDF